MLIIILKSLRNRFVTSSLAVLSIAISVTLFLTIEKVRKGAREGFTNTISKTDLIVGASGGSTQLLMYSVFHLGDAPKNISFKTYQHFSAHKDVAWTIPISMGDSHEGHRVIATNQEFFKHYRFRGDRQLLHKEGLAPLGVFDVSIGSEVARKLNYRIGQAVVIAHGVSDGPALEYHDDKPFTLTGILAPTGTPIDRALFISLEGMEAIHMADFDPTQEVPVKQITSFLLRTNTRLETLRLQREINEYMGESLLAIIPGVALSQLWDTLSYAETAMLGISFFVVIVGLVGTIATLYASLNERRREMSIFRAIGVRPSRIARMLLMESLVLVVAGATLGLLLSYLLLWLASPMIRDYFGVFLSPGLPSKLEWMYLGLLIVMGTLLGLLPALRAYRHSLTDGLAVRI